MRSLKPCGTHAAYVRHWSRSETPCQPCQEAERLFQRDRSRTRRAIDGRREYAVPALAVETCLTTADSRLRRCWWCGQWAYAHATCTACAAPASRSAMPGRVAG